MSLRLRLVLLSALAATAACAWLAWWESDHLARRYQQALESDLVDAANVLAALVASRSPGGEPDITALAEAWGRARAEPPQAIIHALRKDRLDLEVLVTDRRGVVHFDSLDPAAAGRDDSRWNDIARTLQGRYGARATRSDPAQRRTAVLHVAAPIRQGGTIIGVLSVAKGINALAPVEDAHRASLLAAALGIAAVAAAVALLAGAWVSRPLARLTAHVRAAAAGRRAPLPPLGRGEIRELGLALQDLRERLDGRAYAEDFAQALTHELKGPLAGLRAAVELLREDLPEAERQRFLGHLHGECARLSDMVNRILALAGLERRVEPERREACDLGAIVRAAGEALAAEARARGLDLRLGDGPVAPLLGDPFLLRQAVENLLRNAVQFSPRGAVVEAVWERCGANLRLLVSDRGPGLEAHVAARAFERFFSTPRPDDGRKGSGLGLSLVREVARLHGGSAAIANRPGGGAQATLDLPAA